MVHPAPVVLFTAAALLLASCQSPAEPDGTRLDRSAPALLQTRLARTIAFVSDRDGNAEVYAMTSIGTQQINLTQHPAQDLDPSWSADGTTIAFQRKLAGGSEIWRMSAGGTGQTQVTHILRGGRPYARWPRWSPDGSRIAFVRSSSPDVAGDLFVIPVAGGIEKKLASDVGTPPAWSPDGTRLAFVAGLQSPHLYRIDASGAGLTQLAPAGVYSGWEGNPNPCWAPSGPIIYTAKPSGDAGWDLYAIAPEGGAPVRLTNADDNDVRSGCQYPQASNAILASVQVDGNGDIFVSDPNGPSFDGGWKILIHILGGLAARDRGYSADGSKILFYRNVTPWSEDRYQVWVMNPDGTGQHQLTRRGSNWDPAWRP